MSDKPVAKYKHPHQPLTSWSGKGVQPAWIAAVMKANPNATMESLEIGHKNYGAFIEGPVVEQITIFDKMDTGSVKKALALAGGKEGTHYNVPHSKIRVAETFNVRDHDDDYLRHRAWLGDQIVAHGYDRTKPMAGYVVKENGEDVFYLTDGHTRYFAIDDKIKAGKLPADITVPITQVNQGSSPEDLVVSLFTSNTGRGLKPNELATVFKRLLGYGWDEKKIAERFDFTVPYIKDLLLLLTAPKSVREKVAKGEVSATLAVKTIKKEGGQAAEKKLNAAAEKAAAAGKTKITSKHVEKKSKPAKEKAADPEKAAVDSLVEKQAEDLRAEARDAIVQALIVPQALIKDMVAYIKDVMMETDVDAKALLARADALIAMDKVMADAPAAEEF